MAEDTENKLSASEQQLRAANQQLTASEQQLRAANQQLMASEQQLRAVNQQLMASEQQLRAANQQLMASEQEARILAKFPSENPDPVLRISKDNAVLYSNQAAEPILAAWGCEEDRCLCLPERESKLMAVALSSGKLVAFDLDHSNRTFSMTLAPVPESGYVNIYAHDITSRKQSEDALRKSEEKYRQFYEDAPLGYQSLNASGNFLDVNREWVNVLGYSKEEVIGRCFADFVAPESLDTFTKNFPRFKAGGKTRATEFEMIKKDGLRITVSFDGNIEYDKDGHFKRTHCILHDITEHKKAEQTLRESEVKFRELFEHISSGVAVYEVRDNGKDFIFRNFNKAGERIEKVKREEMIGKSVIKLFPGVKEFGLIDVFERVWKTGKPEHHPISLYKDERIVGWRENYVYKLPSGEIVAVYDDVTERKRAEEQLFEYQEKLKSLASQLSVIEERERHRLATDLHDHIGQSLVISKMKLDSLRESMSSGESADVLRDVCDCLGDVIRDTRTLTFDLSSPILYELGFETAVSEWLDEQIKEKHGIQTEFRDDGQPKPLDNDIRALLFRNVRELLINIVKHAKARKVKVSVIKVGEQICVIIEDDGVGFEPAKVGSNTGFGIFSIRERLEQLDGHLEIESEPGRGSRFTMTAPLKVEKSTEGVDV
ncbi:MAG: PAS domain S-box protein [Planctomycetes bacterium]|nr:PAS domain S-box protein [Planctomycetota bacterium]